MDNALYARAPIRAAFSTVFFKAVLAVMLTGLALPGFAQTSRMERLYEVPGSQFPEVLLRWTLPGGCYYYRTLREDFIADLSRYKQTYEWSGECIEGEPIEGTGELLGLSVNFRDEYIPDETPYTGTMVNGRWDGVVSRGKNSYTYRNGCMSEYLCRALFNKLDASLGAQPARSVQASNSQPAGREADAGNKKEQAESSHTDTSKTSSLGSLIDAAAAYQKARQGGANKNDARIAALGGTPASGGSAGSSSMCGVVLPDWAGQCMSRCNEWINYNRNNSHMRNAPPAEREIFLKKNLIGVMIGHKMYHADHYKYQHNQNQSAAKADENFVRQTRLNAAGAEKTLANSAVGAETRVDNAFVYSCMNSAVADEMEKNPTPVLRMSPTVERVMQCPGYNDRKTFSGIVIPTHAGVDREGFDACVRRIGG